MLHNFHLHSLLWSESEYFKAYESSDYNFEMVSSNSPLHNWNIHFSRVIGTK